MPNNLDKEALSLYFFGLFSRKNLTLTLKLGDFYAVDSFGKFLFISIQSKADPLSLLALIHSTFGYSPPGNSKIIFSKKFRNLL